MKQKFKTWLPAIILATVTAFSGRSQVITCTVTNSSCNYVTNGDFEANTLVVDIIDNDPITNEPIYGNCQKLHATGAAFPCSGSVVDNNNTFYGCNWTAGGWAVSSYASADYYNACAKTCWNPSTNSTDNFQSNGIGSMSPHSGDGYAGIFVYQAAGSYYNSSGAPYQESIKQNLSSTLIAGKTYVVSMWVRLSHVSKYAVSDFWINGINFTTSALTNKTGWTLLSTCYTPVANVSQIEIGSNASTLTDLDMSNSWSYGGSYYQHDKVSYYYIDDVSITPLNVNAGDDITLYPGCSSTIGTSTVTSFPCVSAISSSATVSYNWLPNTNLSSNSTATTIASPPSTTTYTVYATVTYTNAAGVVSTCSSSDEVTVFVVTPTLTIVPSVTCNANSAHGFSVTVNPAPVTSYIWSIKDVLTNTVVPITGTGLSTASPTINFQNITRDVYVCAVAINSLGCQSAPQCYYFANCCASYTNAVKHANTTYTNSTIPSGASIAFGGTITVNSGGQLIITNKEVFLEPNTKFVINGTGRIDITNSYLHACTTMWDGIYANTTSSISVTISRIEDAKRVAIDSLGTASFNITGNYFNKNYMGIVFKATKTSTSAIRIRNNLFTCSNIPVTSGPYNTTTNRVIPTTAVPSLATAPTLGAYSSGSLRAPYNTQKSFCGINFGNASHTGKITNGITTNAITIGGIINEENVFDKMQMGVYSYDSKTHFQNNVFQNFKSTIAPTGLTNAGILVWGPIFGAGNGSYLSAGGSLALKNTFRSNDNGLYNVGKSGILATHNTFSVQTTGAYVTGNNNGSVANINFNNFFQTGVAVNFFNNTYLTGNVKNNNMNNTASAVGTFADNFAIRCTEAALATNPSSYPAFDIDNNNISGFFNGIFAVNTLSLIATDNEVHIRQDNANEHWQAGIKFIGTNANKIINNVVDMPSLNQWAYWQTGIFSSLNQVPRVQCNSVNNLANSLVFDGTNSTAAGDGIKSNYMQNAKFGIWIVNNGVIGNQAGNTGTNSSDNVWNIPNIGANLTYYTYSQVSSNPSSHIFFTRSLGSGFDLPNAKAANDGSSFCFSMVGNNSSAAATGTACIANTATPSNQRVAGNALASLMQGADDILTDFDNEQNNGLSMANASANAADNSVDNTVSLKAMNRRHLLYNLVLQNIDVQQDAALSGFMNSIKSNNTGLLLAVDSLIHQAEKKSSIINNAKQANTAIVPNNLVEQSQQEFNTLYLEYLAQNKKLNPAQLSSMISIAQQCPSYYGISVYQARTVLFDINKQSYRNACENVSPSKSSKRMAQTIDNEEQYTNVNVFPNPANNQLFVNADDYTQVSIKLYNIMGVLVADKIVVNNNSIDISNFASGVYTYKVYNNDTELKVGKLIITH